MKRLLLTSVLCCGVAAGFIMFGHNKQLSRGQTILTGKLIPPDLRPVPDTWLVKSADLRAPMMNISIQERASSVTQALQRHQNVPGVSRVAKYFTGHQFRTALIKPDHEIIAAEGFQLGKDPLICIVPEVSNGIMPSLAWLEKNAGCLAIAAIRWGDEAWQDAVTLHELLHYTKYIQGNPSAFAPEGSPAYDAEEAQAHALESNVLDEATQGKYHQIIEKLVDAQKGKSLIETLGNSRSDITEKLDKLFGAATVSEAPLRSAQYELDLAALWYAKQGVKNPLVEAYRILQYGK